MLNIQSQSLTNQKTKIGEDILEAIKTNEYINFKNESGIVDILVHQNKIRLGVREQYGTVFEIKQLSVNKLLRKESF